MMSMYSLCSGFGPNRIPRRAFNPDAKGARTVLGPAPSCAMTYVSDRNCSRPRAPMPLGTRSVHTNDGNRHVVAIGPCRRRGAVTARARALSPAVGAALVGDLLWTRRLLGAPLRPRACRGCKRWRIRSHWGDRILLRKRRIRLGDSDRVGVADGKRRHGLGAPQGATAARAAVI